MGTWEPYEIDLLEHTLEDLLWKNNSHWRWVWEFPENLFWPLCSCHWGGSDQIRTLRWCTGYMAALEVHWESYRADKHVWYCCREVHTELVWPLYVGGIVCVIKSRVGLKFFSNSLTKRAMNASVAGGWTFAALPLRNFMYCLLKSNMTFWTSCWVRGMLWRSSTLWNCWMISRLAWSVLILEVRSSAILEWNHNMKEGQKSGWPLCQKCWCSRILQLTWS